jgi:hypothetical protein
MKLGSDYNCNIPIMGTDFDAYKHCALDYFKGVGPFGSPFAFLSYGIRYGEMLYFAKFSTEFLDFLFDFLISDISNHTADKVILFLAEAGLTAAEIKERLANHD